MEIIHTIFGQGKELNEWQMAARAFVLFFITLGIIRLAGMRTFGKKSAFDDIMVIMLGAVLSRAITGASAFLPTVTAGVVLAIVHKIVAWATIHNKALSKFFKGEKELLYKEGKWQAENLKRCTISKEDVIEEVRTNLNEATLENIKEVYIESTGKISLIKKV